MENQKEITGGNLTDIRISDTRPLSNQERWAQITALTLENERLKSELADKETDIKCLGIMIQGLEKNLMYVSELLNNEREEHKRILAETVKNIREINYPELG